MADEFNRRKYLDYSGADESYDDPMAKLERSQNWKEFYNRQVQQNAVNELAAKYYQNTLRQQGLQSSGEGTTQSVIMANAGLNRLSENYGDYLNKEGEISSSAYARYADEQASKDNALIGYIGKSQNSDQISQYLSNSGLMATKDGNGNIIGITDASGNPIQQDRQAAILNAITMQNNLINANGIEQRLAKQGATPFATFDDLRNAHAKYGNKIGTIGKDYKNESNHMNEMVGQGTGEYNGAVFKLERKHGDGVIYVYYINGRYYQVTADDYANAEKKVYIKDGKEQL